MLATDAAPCTCRASTCGTAWDCTIGWLGPSTCSSPPRWDPHHQPQPGTVKQPPLSFVMQSKVDFVASEDLPHDTCLRKATAVSAIVLTGAILTSVSAAALLLLLLTATNVE